VHVTPLAGLPNVRPYPSTVHASRSRKRCYSLIPYAVRPVASQPLHVHKAGRARQRTGGIREGRAREEADDFSQCACARSLPTKTHAAVARWMIERLALFVPGDGMIGRARTLLIMSS
jgi:hypothetical protein